MQHEGPEWRIKIADFGITKQADGTELRTKYIGTMAYLAPEIRGIYTADFEDEDKSTYSFAVDIWAVGVITFRMITGQLPFPPGGKLVDYVVRGRPFPVMESLSLEATDFVTKTMAASPRHRPNSRQALSSSWILKQEPISNEPDIEVISVSMSASARWSTEELVTPRVTKHVPIPRSRSIAPSSALESERKYAPASLFKKFDLGDSVKSVGFSPDGCWIASHDSTLVRIWAISAQGKFEQVQELKSSRDLEAVAFSPDGRRLMLYGARIIQIWAKDENYQLTKTQQLKSGHFLTSITFSQDGKHLAASFVSSFISLSASRIIRLWTENERGKFEKVRDFKDGGDVKKYHLLIQRAPSRGECLDNSSGLVSYRQTR